MGDQRRTWAFGGRRPHRADGGSINPIWWRTRTLLGVATPTLTSSGLNNQERCRKGIADLELLVEARPPRPPRTGAAESGRPRGAGRCRVGRRPRQGAWHSAVPRRRRDRGRRGRRDGTGPAEQPGVERCCGHDRDRPPRVHMSSRGRADFGVTVLVVGGSMARSWDLVGPAPHSGLVLGRWMPGRGDRGDAASVSVAAAGPRAAPPRVRNAGTGRVSRRGAPG